MIDTKIKAKNMLILMRPQHYIKNFLIFVPLVFSKNLSDFSLFGKTLLGFLAFSLLASVVYIFNDIHDVDADRLHEIKRNRPIASGKISIPVAYGIIGVLLVISIACNLVCGFGFRAFVIMTLYFVTNL